MVPRSLLMFGLLFASLLAISPAHADDADDRVTVSGTVWVDENLDGMRQPSEPVVSGVRVRSQYVRFPPSFAYGPLGPSPKTDEHGQYTLTELRRFDFRVEVYIKRPGYLPVRTFWDGKYSHYGCTRFQILPAGNELVADIRVVQNGSVSAREWPVANGHFFTEGSIYACDTGFAVTNAGGVTFWDTWQRLGLENVGYPISRRFEWKGYVTQVFQKAVFQWRLGKGVVLVDLYDELHEAGRDHWLRIYKFVPQRLETSFKYADAPMMDHIGSRDTASEDPRVTTTSRLGSLALLDANQATKERYFAAPDPLWQFGLPTSRVEDYGKLLTIRTQKAVFQQWKEDVPWAKAGEVTIANGGEIAKRYGLFAGHEASIRTPTRHTLPEHL